MGWTQLIGLGRRSAVERTYRVPDDRRIYVVGDIHGRADLLARLHADIAADAAAADKQKWVVVYLGDYVDRGLQSFEVLEMLIHEPLQGFERVHLRGNHEDMMLKFLDAPRDATWLYNGGDATLASYGVLISSMMMLPSDLADLSSQLAEALPAEHRNFLDGLDYVHVEGDYLFVHAGLRPGVPLAAQRHADMMWIRERFLSSDADFGRRIVHGHSIRTDPDVRPNRIGIDTGAYVTGRLTCLVLDGAEQRFIQT